MILYFRHTYTHINFNPFFFDIIPSYLKTKRYLKVTQLSLFPENLVVNIYKQLFSSVVMHNVYNMIKDMIREDDDDDNVRTQSKLDTKTHKTLVCG